MTALVGILNKKAAVMAADSAVTVTRGETSRIYNNMTKIFSLHKTDHVGLMLFNNIEFMGVPLSILIKIFKEQRSNHHFDTLHGYVDDFIDFLGKEKMFQDNKMQHTYLFSEIGTYYDKVKSYAADEIQKTLSKIGDRELTQGEISNLQREKLKEGIAAITEMVKENDKSPRFENYTFKKFLAYAKEDIDVLMDLCKDEELPLDMREDWEKGIYEYLCSKVFYNGTGLVFVGYGNDEIFPSLIPIYISGIFDGNFRFCYSTNEEEHINFDNASAIVPFAQTDVMMTVMKGISPALLDKVAEATADAVSQTKDKMIEAMKAVEIDDETIAKLQEIELKEVSEKHEEQIQAFIQTEYVNGLVDTVEAFGVEDMANMAESLISITNLQRHITASEESVGGPIDVAVITRDDGFVWLKHNSWIPADLNVSTR